MGIGRATAHQFAENGAKAVFICDFNGDTLETHKREMKSLYPDVEVIPKVFDASDEESVKAVVDEAIQKYGRLDVFYANAGISSGKVFYDYTAAEFMNMMKVNALRSAFLNRRSRTCSDNVTVYFLPPNTHHKPCLRRLSPSLIRLDL